jgi:type III secretion protein V
MRDSADLSLPEVTLIVELDACLRPVLDATNPRHAAVRNELALSLANLLDALGIPGSPVVRLIELPANALDGQFLRVSVNGRRCRYSDELLGCVLSYVQSDPVLRREQPAAVLERFRALAEDAAPPALEFLALAVLEILKEQPFLLLDVPQVTAYIASLPAPAEASFDGKAWPPHPAALLAVLRAVLALRLSLADRHAVMNTLMRSGDCAPVALSEDLITTLVPEVIEVQLPRAYLRELTLAAPPDEGQLFPFLRDGLFAELGLVYPQFRWVVAEELKPHSWRFKIGHLSTLPVVGPKADRLLVNDTPERLQLLNVAATPAVNPATNQPNSFVELHHRDRLVAAGLTTWTLPQYLILSLAAALRRQGAAFIHRRSVEAALKQLEPVFPATVKAVYALVPIERVTRVIRALAAEQVSVRNLGQILQGLMEYDGPEDLSGLVAAIRMGLARELGYKLGRNTRTVVVYLFDGEIEKLLQPAIAESSDGSTEDAYDADLDRIAAAIRAEMRQLPSTAQVPVLLTTAPARPKLRALAALEFPRFAVAAYEDLPPDINIQPVARIALQA